LKLHKNNYGRVSEKKYDSFYLGNPYGDPLLGLCFDGQMLVGQENYVRQDIVFDGVICRSALGIDTIVDPKYRLIYGVFKELIQLTMNKMKEDKDILCAFANEESKTYYTKYFSWRISAKVEVYKKIISYSGLSPEGVLAFLKPGKVSKDLSLNEVSEFDPEILGEIIGNHSKCSKYSYFYKTAEFLNWKFLRNQHYNLRGYLIVLKGVVSGYVITYEDGIELKIADFLIQNDDSNVFEKTISFLCYIGSKKGKTRLVIYATPDCWYMQVLKKQIFIKRWNFDFITANLNKAPIGNQWVIQIGDFDIF
jgi:hypothetical protein